MKTRNGLFADVPEELWNDWHWQLDNRIETAEELKKHMPLTADEEEGVKKTLGKLRMAVTPYYLSLIDLDDPFENMGAQLVKEVSTKTNDVAGDGTTTATLLAQAIIREGLKNLAAGANPMVMKKGIAKATETAVEAIKANSQKVNGTEDIARVGTISAGDEVKVFSKVEVYAFVNGINFATIDTAELLNVNFCDVDVDVDGDILT